MMNSITMNNTYFGPLQGYGHGPPPTRPPRQQQSNNANTKSNNTTLSRTSTSNSPNATLTVPQSSLSRQSSLINHRLAYPKLATCDLEIYNGPKVASIEETSKILSNVSNILNKTINNSQSPSPLPNTDSNDNPDYLTSLPYEESILQLMKKHKSDEQQLENEREQRQIQRQ